MKISLEEILEKYYFKAVMIKLTTWSDFDLKCYLVGIKLPIRNMLMLYYVKEQHIEKYLKHQNPRWVEMLPFEMLDEIKIIMEASEDVEDLVRVAMMKKDITYQEDSDIRFDQYCYLKLYVLSCVF